MSAARVACIVPVFDHAATVGEVARGAAEHVELVIVVDDGSTDGSGDAVESLIADGRSSSEIILVRHEENRGKGAAVLLGLSIAGQRGFTAGLVLDADGQHRPSDVPQFVRHHARNSDSIVIGERDLSPAHVPESSRFGRAFSNFWVRRTAVVDLPDTQSGFRLLPIRAVTLLPVRARRYDYEVEMLVRAAWAQIPIETLPIDVWYPPREDRVSHFRTFHDNARISWAYTRLLARRLLPWPTPTAARTSPEPVRARPSLRRLFTFGARPVDVGVAIGVGAWIGTLPWVAASFVVATYVAVRTGLNPLVVCLATAGAQYTTTQLLGGGAVVPVVLVVGVAAAVATYRIGELVAKGRAG